MSTDPVQTERERDEAWAELEATIVRLSQQNVNLRLAIDYALSGFTDGDGTVAIFHNRFRRFMEGRGDA